MRWLYNLPGKERSGLIKSLEKMYGLKEEDALSSYHAATRGKIIGDPQVPPKSPFTLAQLKKMGLIGVYEDE